MKEQLTVGQVLSRAFALLEAGRVAESRHLARTLESQRPEPTGLPYLLGLLALAEGQGRKAAQHLARALAQTPGALPPLLALARAQALQSRATQAGTAYRLVLALAPDLAAGWSELADLLLQQGDFSAALIPLLRTLRLAPPRPALLNNLGIAARAAGRAALAERSFSAAILLDPGSAKSYANRAGLRRHRQDQASPDAMRAVRLAGGDPALHLELGQALLQEGNKKSALAEFLLAADLLPDQPEPLWLAAEALRRLGREGEAASHYRRILALDAEDRLGARLALAQLGQGDVPERAAAAHVRALYDQYAGSFERNLLGELAYRGPEIILDGLRRAGLRAPLDIFDAGCGTGLMGQAIKGWARRLDGADLSAKMVAQAESRGIYDSLAVGDLLPLLQARPARYDLVVAADVLIYLGDLHAVAEAAFTALRPGGVFAFTVERSDDQPFRLQPSGRFAHSADHLRQVAADQGYDLALCEPVSTRTENNRPVAGLLCILRKR